MHVGRWILNKTPPNIFITTVRLERIPPPAYLWKFNNHFTALMFNICLIKSNRDVFLVTAASQEVVLIPYFIVLMHELFASVCHPAN